MKRHDLKIRPQYFTDILVGKKEFEIRYNDRNYKVGDELELREYDGVKYTGKHIRVLVTYIYDDTIGLKTNYIIMGIKLIKVNGKRKPT